MFFCDFFKLMFYIVTFCNILLSGNVLTGLNIYGVDFFRSNHSIHHNHNHHHQKECNNHSNNKEHESSEKQCCHYHGEEALTVLLNSSICFKKELVPNSKTWLCFWETFFLNEPLPAQTNRIIDRSLCLDPPEIDCIQQAFFKSTVQLL